MKKQSFSTATSAGKPPKLSGGTTGGRKKSATVTMPVRPGGKPSASKC